MISKFATIYKVLFSDKPRYVIFNISNTCNLKCKQCSIWKYPRKDIISLDKRKQIIDKLQKWLGSFHLNLSGGEPFAQKETIKLMQYCARKNIHLNINTNGTLLDDSVIKIIKSNPNNIQIIFSLDSDNPSTHDYLRGQKNVFSRLTKTIEKFRKIEFKNYSIATVISEKNIDSLIKLCDLAISSGATKINFQPLDLYLFQNHMKTLAEFKKHELWPKKMKIVKKQISELIEYKKSANGYIINNSREELANFIEYFQNPFNPQRHCSSDKSSIYIGPDANVYLCGYFRTYIGNALEDDFKSMYTSKKKNEIDKYMRACTMPCKMLSCHRRRDIKFYLGRIGL